ncbi:hypothetical protein [Leeia sp.]|uniref:J domain-containing protein n=1 Tax=Leeia sp. TaxID=2884678 RepID=UPI0035AF0989
MREQWGENTVTSCWDILGIEATSDIRLIKRAYAKLLKVNRPEDDAEAFQRLRDAHEEALERAAWMLEEEEEGQAELVESATQEATSGSPATPLGEDFIRNEFAATVENGLPPVDADERIEPHSADSTTTLEQWHQQVLALLDQPEALLRALNEIWTDPRLQLSLGPAWERSLLYLCAQHPTCLSLLLVVDAHYGWREGRSELPLHHHQAWAVLRKQLLLCEVDGKLRHILSHNAFAFKVALQGLLKHTPAGLEEREWLECHVAEVLSQHEQLPPEILDTAFVVMGWDHYPSHLPKNSRQQIEYLHSVRRDYKLNLEYDSLLEEWRALSRMRKPWGEIHQQQVMQSLFEPVPRWRLKLWAMHHKAQLFAAERLSDIDQLPDPVRDRLNQRGIAFWRERHVHMGANPVMSLAIASVIWFCALMSSNNFMVSDYIAGHISGKTLLVTCLLLAIPLGGLSNILVQQGIQLKRAWSSRLSAWDELWSHRWLEPWFPWAYSGGWRLLRPWRSGALAGGGVALFIALKEIGEATAVTLVSSFLMTGLLWWLGTGLRARFHFMAEQERLAGQEDKQSLPWWGLLLVIGGLLVFASKTSTALFGGGSEHRLDLNQSGRPWYASEGVACEETASELLGVSSLPEDYCKAVRAEAVKASSAP